MNGIVIYIVLFIVLFIFLNYNYYKQKRREYIEEKRQEELDLDSFFYHSDILKSKRRKIWIYLPTERNSRLWESFGSRTSTHLNLSLMNLCIKSVIDWCSQSYDIVLFTDDDINEILNTRVDLSSLSGDVLEKHRLLNTLEILYEYGGILLPPTLYLRNNLKHQDAMDRFYVCDMVNTNNVSMSRRNPSSVIMGSLPKDEQLRDYIDYLRHQGKEEFEENYFKNKNVFILDGSIFGTKTKDKKDVTLDDLMSNKKLQFPEYNIGLYMPCRELLDRNLYKWYCKMSERQVLDTHCAFSYYMLENS